MSVVEVFELTGRGVKVAWPVIMPEGSVGFADWRVRWRDQGPRREGKRVVTVEERRGAMIKRRQGICTQND